MIVFNEVTWYSKLAAIVFFLAIVPLLTFYMGMQYGSILEMKRVATLAPVIVPSAVAPVPATEISYEMIPGNNPAFSFPQITTYPNVEIKDQTNETLRQAFALSGCGVPSEAEQGYEWNVVTTVDYAQNDIFSVNASGNYFCGGAYPVNNYSQTFTFDMKTGETVAFVDLFESFETDKEAIIETIYAAQIELATLSEGIAEEGSCSTVNTLETLLNYTHDYRLDPTSQSITVRPQYPHVLEACITPVTIQIEQLLPFAPAEGLLYRL